jgi:hypothetical protein
VTVVSNFVVQDPPETDGSGERIVTYVYQFHDGDFRQRSLRRPVTGFDYEAEATAMIADIELEMRTAEIDRLVETWETDDQLTDPIAVEPIHPETDTSVQRRRRFRRRLARRLIRSNNIKEVRRILYPIWQWMTVDQGMDTAAATAYLNITITRWNTFNARMQAYDSSLTFIDGEASDDWGD